MPPYRREMPASSAAAENVGQASVMSVAGTMPGSTFELPATIVAAPPNVSPRVNRRKISAPAALKLLWPDEYSGKGGVGK